ncbi:RND family efflux transporter, MFP subunit [Caulobacter sp. UNC279MFTsu5.1]|nr:RND family efflux transporter, MFP subunit [Caulobacter sp. UNC279MFTsu5.1]
MRGRIDRGLPGSLIVVIPEASQRLSGTQGTGRRGAVHLDPGQALRAFRDDNRWGASGAAFAALLALAACGPAKAPAAPPPPQAVEAVAVSAPRAAGGVTATGTLERRREMALSFRIAGVLTRVAVEAGDPVRAGQVLATIDPAAVDARQQASSADLDKARRELDRARTLYAKGYVAKARLDDAESAVRSASAAYGAAAFDRRWAQLVSPASGVVLERRAQAGEVVQPGQAVVSVADLNSPLVLRAPLPDRDVAGIGVGAPVEVTVDALPGQVLAGRVTRLGQSADARTGAVTVEIEVAARPELRSGQIATARLARRAPASPGPAFARVPAEAVLEASGGQAAVLRLDNGPGGMRARRTPVRFGGFDGDDALVAGLPDGARVITAGAGFVSDGDRVTVTDPKALGGKSGR